MPPPPLSITDSILLLTILAPMVGLLVARYGERTVAIVGSVVASIGYISSAFSTNIYHLQITFGVIGGWWNFLYFVYTSFNRP